jgi:predicted RNA binding protein YcfA (HicA-like mRNA interferase family)
MVEELKITGAAVRFQGDSPVIAKLRARVPVGSTSTTSSTWRSSIGCGSVPQGPAARLDLAKPLSYNPTPAMKVREAMQLLEADGWYLHSTKGSHRQYKHPIKPGRVTVPGKASADLPPGTLASLLRQAGLK